MTSVSFDVPIINDNVLEDNKNFILTIRSSSLPDRVTRGTLGQATITIVDNDGKCLYYIGMMKIWAFLPNKPATLFLYDTLVRPN